MNNPAMPLPPSVWKRSSAVGSNSCPTLEQVPPPLCISFLICNTGIFLVIQQGDGSEALSTELGT